MRLDLPDEVPRRRAPNRSAPPLAPSPVEPPRQRTPAGAGRGGKGQRLTVSTLANPARNVARHISDLAPKQKLYAGLVKPREVEHDTQIYRAYGKESERIKEKGGTNLRVKLDFELK